MDRLYAMQVFVTAAETEGFSQAARKLNISPPAVTRAIAELEKHLGLLLFHRTTRQIKLTDAGLRFIEDAQRIISELAEAEESAKGAHRAVSGKLSITASQRFGYTYITPLLLDFLERYPDISIQTLFVDRVVDLLDEGFDIAVRIGDLPDSSLTAMRVGSVRRIICATPEYLKTHGRPHTPNEISTHEIIHFAGISQLPVWNFMASGRVLSVPFKTRLAVNNAEVAIAAALAGRGLIRVLSYQVAPEVEAGKLEIVLSEFETEPLPIHIVYQEGKKATAKVRAFVDFATEKLRSNAAINN